MTKLLTALDALELGLVQYNFLLKHDGECEGKQGGPKFSTRKYNPRETTKESLKNVREQFQHASGGLVKDCPEFAIFMAVRPAWIVNLEEIKQYRWDGSSPLPRIKWTSQARNQVAELLNGNHRFHLLREQCKEQLGQLQEVEDRQRQIREDMAKGVEITRGRKEQQKKDLDLEAQLKEILQKEGLFAVKLFDLGE